MMRGINTTVRRLRRKVFEEVAALGFKADADTLFDDMEAMRRNSTVTVSTVQEQLYESR